MTTPIRIKATSILGGVAYVHREGGGSFRCTLANGIPASLSYAGILADEMACRFALDDCSTGLDALAIVKQLGSATYRYELFSPVRIDQADPIAVLSALKAEVQRLEALIPVVSEQIDNRVLDRARALVTDFTANGRDAT